MNTYRLAKGAVECDARGLFVGGVALLSRRDGAGFTARAIGPLNEELSKRYGAPIEAEDRAARLNFVAACLERGELALAQIAALMLRFPDPPLAAPSGPEDQNLQKYKIAAALNDAGLLKGGDWDESKHPRAGVPPNPGWFAAKPKDELASAPGPTEPEPAGWRRLSQRSFRWLGSWRFVGFLVRAAGVVAEKISFLASLEEYIRSFFVDPASQPSTGDANADEIEAAKDPPKTLQELQKPPTHYQLGYDRHHIVEQNPANIAKRHQPLTVLFRKFGRAMLDDPSNIVWVPRRNHWKITAQYNRREAGDTLGRLHRYFVNQLDFAAQREAGLAAMREAGVLK